MIEYQQNYSRQFYNLIVAEDNPKFEGKQVMANNCLLLGTTETLRKQLMFFGEEEQATLITYPTLFCHYDDFWEMAYVGKIRNIEVRPATVLFRFESWASNAGFGGVAKKDILENYTQFDIGYRPTRNELQRVHWAVKEADLIGVVREMQGGK